MQVVMTAVPEIKIICLLDVLGFKSHLTRLGLAALHVKYEDLVRFVRDQTGGLNIVATPSGHPAVGWLTIGNAYFSDSLLFWTRYNVLHLSSYTQLIAEAICFGLEIALPLRGAVAVGEVILDDHGGVFLGQPLVEVALAERIQQWIGVSFGPSFRDPQYRDGFLLNTVLPYKTH